MKYIIKSLWNFGQMKFWDGDRPKEDNGGDQIFSITWEPSDEDAERLTDKEYLDAEMPSVLYIPVSQIYQFIENVRSWAPDVRKPPEDEWDKLWFLEHRLEFLQDDWDACRALLIQHGYISEQDAWEPDWAPWRHLSRILDQIEEIRKQKREKTNEPS